MVMGRDFASSYAKSLQAPKYLSKRHREKKNNNKKKYVLDCDAPANGLYLQHTSKVGAQLSARGVLLTESHFHLPYFGCGKSTEGNHSP